jgi:hypothetical protein
MGIKAPAQGGEAGDDITTVCFYDRWVFIKFQGRAKNFGPVFIMV